MIISLILIGLGLYVMWRGEIAVTANRKLSPAKGRLIGALIVIVSILQYLFIDGPWVKYGPVWGLISILLFFVVIVLGYVLADRVPDK